MDEFHSNGNALKKALGVNSAEDEAALVQGFRTLGRGTDADGRERMAYAGEEAGFLRKGAGVRDHAESVHLKAVVVMEAKRLVLDDTPVKLEAASLKTLSGSRMAAVEDWHIILLGHLVDCVEEAEEILLSINVLLTVSAEEDVFALFKAKALMDIAGFYLCKIVMKNLSHWRACDIGALLWKACIGKVTARML